MVSREYVTVLFKKTIQNVVEVELGQPLFVSNTEKRSISAATLIFFLALLLAVSPVGCSAAADTLTPTEPGKAPAAEPPQFTIKMDTGEINIPQGIPPGLVQLTIDNIDTEWHAAIIRQLNEGVSVEEFGTAFAQDPRSTFPLTSFIGGPDVPGNTSMSGYYTLHTGTYIVVDNWTDPWRFESFQVEGETVSDQLPQADVVVQMKEYNFDMPDSLPSGRHLWQFTNQGEFLHNLGIIRLSEGKSMDDLIAWSREGQGPEPFEYFTMWNILSPGTTSWGEIELQPGEYLAVDFMPDFASEDGWNIEQGMVQTFTVAP